MRTLRGLCRLRTSLLPSYVAWKLLRIFIVEAVVEDQRCESNLRNNVEMGANDRARFRIKVQQLIEYKLLY